jgi:hypothetical protein
LTDFSGWTHLKTLISGKEMISRSDLKTCSPHDRKKTGEECGWLLPGSNIVSIRPVQISSERKSKMRKVLITCLLALAGTLFTLPQLMAADAVFRWVDQDGNVHFGDHPPEGVEAVQINVRANTVSTVSSSGVKTAADDTVMTDAATDEQAAAEDQGPELSYAQQRRNDRAEARKKRVEEEALRNANCAVMRTQKLTAESGPRVLVDDGQGGVRRLTDDERVEALNEANTYLATNCN